MKAVSVKSTKQDILEAYEELTQQIVIPTSSAKAGAKADSSAIAKSITALKDLIPELEKEQVSQLKETETAKLKLDSFYRDLTRTEEELRYKLKKDQTEKSDELDSTLKAQKLQFDAEYAKKLADLSARESKLEESEKELKELRDDAKVAPARVAMELKKAVEAVRAEEQTIAKHSADLLAKDHDGIINLANQKIQMIEKVVADQSKEIVSLKSAYDHAAEQMKSMAVSLIEANRPLPAPPTPSKE